MNNIFISILLIFMLFSSCTTKPLETYPITFLASDLELCKEVSCPEVTIDYLKISGDSEEIVLLNTEIEQSIINLLYIGDETEAPSASSISEATEEFIKTYRFEHAEFPDMSAAYFAEISQTKGLSTSEILSITSESYFFTGGAHGYSSVTFINANPMTGKLYTLPELVKDEASFLTFAEERFRDDYDIATTENINATGFWFKDETFYVPEHFGFTKTSMILYYNEYEIAPYASGPTQFEIPLSEVAAYLTIDLDDLQ